LILLRLIEKGFVERYKVAGKRPYHYALTESGIDLGSALAIADEIIRATTRRSMAMARDHNTLRQ